MWFIFALLTFTFWGLADLFYKKGNKEDDTSSHYKTGMMVGFIMGLHATIYLLIVKPPINLISIIKYLPVSLCYISSMVIGYKGLKYLDLSISSPIQNSSGIITSLLLVIIYKVILSDLEWIGIIFIGLGVIFLSFLENHGVIKKKMSAFTIFFPIMYALLDGLGTFLDGIYLDQLKIVSGDTALVCYEYTFLIYAIILFIIFRFKKHRMIKLREEKDKVIAAIFETAGQFFYVFAMASHSVITAPIVAAYSILSIILSHIFLKEKLTRRQYVTIAIIIIGIIIIGVAEEIV